MSSIHRVHATDEVDGMHCEALRRIGRRVILGDAALSAQVWFTAMMDATTEFNMQTSQQQQQQQPQQPTPHSGRRRRRTTHRFNSMAALLLSILLALVPLLSNALSTFNYHLYDTLQFQVVAPAPMVGNLTYTPAVYGNSIVNPPDALGLELEIVLAYPDPTACMDLRGSDGVARTVDGRPYSNKVMLILRGDCTFGQKTVVAENAGAAMAVVYSCSPAPPSLCKPERDQMYSGSALTNLTTLMIDYLDGSILNAALQVCYPLPPPPPQPAMELNGFFGQQAQLPFATATPDVRSNCSIVGFFPGTGPIDPRDRAALTRISEDMVFTFENDRSGQSGPLPPFSAIQNHTLDACVNRVAGIWCQGTPGRIVILDLDNMNLTGVLSDGIGDLTALQQLTLSDNHFWCTALHCSAGNLTDLRVLNMFAMDLLGFQPEGETCLDPLTKLLAVDASYNKIEELTDSMLKWSNLRALNVANNGIISQLDVSSLTVFRQLEYLNFASNSIFMNLDGLSFHVLSHLQYLYMGSNLLQGTLDWHAFDDLPLLLEVDISNNHLIGRLPGFAGTNNLQKLDLSQNALTGNCTAWFMPNLTYLSLGSNQLTEPLEMFPHRFQSLQFMDLSNNGLTIDASQYNDVGAYLFSIMPLSVQTVHLEYNNLTGNWGPGFLTSYNTLSHFFISNNQLNSIPNDLFEIGGSDTLIDLDLSFNELVGTLPSLPPSPVIASVKFNGNPGLQSPLLQLPSWATIDPKGSFTSTTDTYACASLVGTAYHLTVSIDPSYYGWQWCECSRGTYGTPPDCPEIPFFYSPEYDDLGAGTFTDEMFGDKRFFVGVDTSFVVGRFNFSSGISSSRVRSEVESTADDRVKISSRPLRRFATVIENSGRNVHSVQLTADETEGSADRRNATSLSNEDDLPPYAGVIRVIYVTFRLNESLFWGQDESITVYVGDLNLRGDRMIMWQGTDPSYSGNIDLGNLYPPQTVTILGSSGVINFRSRHSSGQHFDANFTLSSTCPPGYLVMYDVLAIPEGYCGLPPGTSVSTTVILLLVTSVIIGMLALCLLGQKMSTIQGLINGDSLHAPREGMDTNEQAREIYGPVLSVEEAWRRQLKRDLGKEVLMFLLELAGYISNWLVVVEELNRKTGPIRSDPFLILYMVIVVASTVSGSVSVFARVRVMREIFRELTLGLAVVPTIEMLLHHARQSKEEKQQQAVEVVDYTRTFEQYQKHQQQRQAPAKLQASSDDLVGLDDSIGSLGHRNGKMNGALSAFGRPLLDPHSSAGLDSHDFEDQNAGLEMSVDTAHSLQHQGGNRTRNGNGKTRSYSPSTASGGSGSGSGGSGGGFRSATLMSSNSDDSDLSQEELHAVRLSSKDPNVQLAWVQRTISTTKLTSFNLIFSTLPFLILNQIRMFRNNSLVSDWALQVSSLFATMLLGVKLIRILALGELIQRRNELVFEVIIAGTGKAMLGGANNGGGTGDKDSNHTGGGGSGGGLPRRDSFKSGGVGGSPLPRAHSMQHHASSSSAMRPGSGGPTKNPFIAPSSSFAGGGPSTLLHSLYPASSSMGGGNDAAFAEHGPFDPLPPIEPQSLMAPASSLLHSSSALGSAATAAPGDLFASSAAAAPPSRHDEITSWARANGGSTLQLHALNPVEDAGGGDEQRADDASLFPAASSVNLPSSGSGNSSRTLSSNDWMQEHESAETSTAALPMQRMKSQN